MPTSLFSLLGRWSACPQTGGLLASGSITDSSPISEQVTIDMKNEGGYTLVGDGPVVVDFGGVVDANVVMIVADRPISIILTCPSIASGAPQTITGDSIRLISRSIAYTAISIQRQPATLTNVTVFLGEKA